VKNVLLLLVSVGVSLLLLELGLRAYTPFPIHWRSHQVPDPILRWVMDPSREDIDADGFRNPGVPETAAIVAIGDSHTYGFNARSDESWPAQLARLSGSAVSNLGMGGYGPLQYLHLTERALELQPRWVIVALYLANDLKDVCRNLTRMEHWRSWAERNGIDTADCGTPKTSQRWGERERSLGSWLQTNTALGSLVALTTRDWRTARKLKRGEVRPHQAIAVVEPGVQAELKHRTVRHVARDLDLDDPRHARALEVMTFALTQANARTDAAGRAWGFSSSRPSSRSSAAISSITDTRSPRSTKGWSNGSVASSPSWAPAWTRSACPGRRPSPSWSEPWPTKATRTRCATTRIPWRRAIVPTPRRRGG
jgi:hypothetical protein